MTLQRTHQYFVSPTKSIQNKSNYEEKRTHHHSVIPTRSVQVNLIMRKQLRNSLQTNWPISFKKYLCHETKSRLRNCFRIKETKEI